MSTVVVVRKRGFACIAADTLTKWGSAKESADYIAGNSKLVPAGDSWLGVTGGATYKTILRDWFAGRRPRLDSPLAIFRTWQTLHKAMKDRYFLQPGTAEGLESSQVDVLIANPRGIFGIGAHRTAQEYSRFYAYGSGSSYAMGALWALYDDPALDAEALARRAVEAAAEFDDATGLPVESRRIRIAPSRKR